MVYQPEELTSMGRLADSEARHSQLLPCLSGCNT